MIPERLTVPTKHPRWAVQVTDDGSRTLIDPACSVAFHSGCGALAETQCVYLRNCGVVERLKSRVSTRVLEVGLGTGMGLLATLEMAMKSQADLKYVALESDWLSAEVIGSLRLEEWFLPELVRRFITWRERETDSAEGDVLRWRPEVEVLDSANGIGPDIQVDLRIGDGVESSTLLSQQGDRFDAIYFDPFDPATCPELWESNMLDLMYRLLDDRGVLATYCVNRKVRDRFAKSGFDVYRLRGPNGGKREVMIARKSETGVGNANLKIEAFNSQVSHATK